MKKLKIKDNIWWIGSTDHNLRVFDIIMYTEFGTSYNSYLIKGSEKTAVVETVKYTFTEEYLERLQEEIDVTTIDYIIVSHTEPDHSSTVGALLELAPQAVVVGSKPAIRFLKMIANRKFDYITVGDGDALSLGDKNLEFISAPFLHWPDTIYTYCPEDKTLFTCDSFGAHYASDQVLLSKVESKEDYDRALEYYFNMIFGPFKSHMLTAIAKIEQLDIDMICNGHGPIIDVDPWAVINQYKEWATVPARDNKKVVIPYVSAYGYTKAMALKIQEGIESVGDVEVELYDLVEDNEADVIEAIGVADGLLLGSPTINGDALYPIMKLLLGLSPLVHNKLITGAFGSFGWSGEAVDNITRRLNELRTKVVPGLKVNFKPDEDELLSSFNFGVNFGQLITGEQAYKAVKAIGADGEEDNFVYDGTVKKWICVVCGEVFDGVKPPAVCPACGATSEQFEEYVEEKVMYESHKEEHFIIVGNGAAGVAAAKAIRKRNTLAHITMLDKEDQVVYYKPMLSEYIGDDEVLNKIYLHEHNWYKDNVIDLRLGEQVTKIDREEQVIETSNNERIHYDKLILALGSHSFVPPILNSDFQGVFTLRNIGDADKIKAYAKNSKKAVIVGGGLLGLEAADELNDLGLDITVVELANRILPRQVDEKGATIFEAGIEKQGIKLIKGNAVKMIMGHHKAEAIQLMDGSKIDADLVIISAGIVSDGHIAEEAELEYERSIVVNEHMQTSDARIFAAGDVAQHGDKNYAIWPEAIEQGNVAGANAVGDTLVYEDFIPSNIFNGLGLNVFSTGQVNYNEGEEVTTLAFEDPDDGVYKRLFFVEGGLNGAVIIGDNSKSKIIIDGMKSKVAPKAMLKVLK